MRFWLGSVTLWWQRYRNCEIVPRKEPRLSICLGSVWRFYEKWCWLLHTHTHTQVTAATGAAACALSISRLVAKNWLNILQNKCVFKKSNSLTEFTGRRPVELILIHLIRHSLCQWMTAYCRWKLNFVLICEVVFTIIFLNISVWINYWSDFVKQNILYCT